MYLNIHMVLFLTLLLLRLSENKTFNVGTKEIAKLLEEGRKQYNLIEQRSIIPQYGLCWKSSVAFLHEGCKRLTENTQIEIALKFTDCFLKMSGHEPYECEKHLSHIWHEETEKTIDRLSTSSAHVTRQLEEAEVIQTVLLQQQRESMSVQQELLNNGLSLKEILHSFQDNLHAIMREFRTSILEQNRILFDVFDRLTSLQAWAVGEISWLDTIVFYIGSIIVSYIVTATQRTQGARIWIFVIISVNAVIERIVVRVFLQENMEQLEVLNKNLYWWIWQCRKVMLTISAVSIGVAVYQYCDYNAVNHELLLQIQKQNIKVINCLEKIRDIGNNPDQKVTHENKLEEVSHAVLLEPAKLAKEISVLQRMKLHPKAKSASPRTVNTGRSDISAAHSEKRQYSSRMTLEIQTPGVPYSLRSMQRTPSRKTNEIL